MTYEILREFWRFLADGGCESCGAVAGEYDYPPGGPHENCNCSTVRVEIGEICILLGTQELSRELIGEIRLDIGPGSQLNSTIQQVSQQWEVEILKEIECCTVKNGETQDCEVRYEGDTEIEWVDIGEVEVVEV